MAQQKMLDAKFDERKARAKKMVAYLKKAYPQPKTGTQYKTPFQLVASVIMSAQATDKAVNRVTEELWKKYKTVDDFANADLALPSRKKFPRSRSTRIKPSTYHWRAQIESDFKGRCRSTIEELTTFRASRTRQRTSYWASSTTFGKASRPTRMCGASLFGSTSPKRPTSRKYRRTSKHSYRNLTGDT
jgi:hypothetical protein